MKFSLLLCVSLLCIACNQTTKEEVKASGSMSSVSKIPADYNPEGKLKELEIVLRDPGSPLANYVHAVRSGNLIFLSGKGPKQANGENITGKLGLDLTLEEGYVAAREAGINLLSVLKSELGNLNKVKRVVNVKGMVNAVPDFKDQSKVVNGCSDLMVAIFGENGKHSRAAVGMGSLPGNMAVEVEMIVEVWEE